MTYTRSKRIEDGATAIDIQTDTAGVARFVLHQQVLDASGQPCWTPFHLSGLYSDAASAEADARIQSDRLRRNVLAGMTVNERLSFAGLMGRWDQAVGDGNRDEMISVLSEVELADQAADIVASVLRRPEA
ncbi:MAG: hypothetical protein JWM33_755 [Caulobacteraceae bacterium]|nr:hypothetical protein [Caulobacteraceae bacterium]